MHGVSHGSVYTMYSMLNQPLRFFQDLIMDKAIYTVKGRSVYIIYYVQVCTDLLPCFHFSRHFEQYIQSCMPWFQLLLLQLFVFIDFAPT